MRKSIKSLLKLSFLTLSCVYMLCMPVYANTPTFSEFWFQDSQGNWKVRDNNGNTITNAWLCDDAVSSNGQDVWYLIDATGNMVSTGLVQDQTGNIYSLETSHNGYYGMLRYKSGAYDGVYLDLESSHGGSFAKIKNQEGVTGLQGIYGLTQVNIDNSNCVYTSSFRNNGGYADNKQKTPETINIGGQTYYVSDYYNYDNEGSDFNPSQEFLDLADEMAKGPMLPGF